MSFHEAMTYESCTLPSFFLSLFVLFHGVSKVYTTRDGITKEEYFSISSPQSYMHLEGFYITDDYTVENDSTFDHT